MEQQDGEQAEQHEVPEESIEKKPQEYQNVSTISGIRSGRVCERLV